MKVLSFGEILWDIYPDGKYIGGAPLNFAAHCAALGAKAWLVSAVGRDELGKETIEQTEKLGVNTEYVAVLSEKETGKCYVALDENAVPAYNLLDDVAYDYIPMPQIKEDADVIAFGTLALRRERNLKTLAQILNNHAFPEIFTDVNIRAPFYSRESVLFCLENATIMKISEDELPIVTEVLWGEKLCLKDTTKKISENYAGIKMIIVTRGANGSCCYDCITGEFFFTDAKRVNVVSTVGAGDSFSAAFLVKYMENKTYRESLEFASKISAFVCSKAEAVPQNTLEMVKSEP